MLRQVRGMDVQSLDLPGVKLLTPRRFADARGYFAESYNARAFAEATGGVEFVQDNESLSEHVGTVRGLHYQAPPFAQAKLVRVVQGAVFDVAVDVRKGSPTYGRWTGAELSADNGRQLFVPAGFLHGFVTRAPETLVLYKVDNYYDRDSDGAVHWLSPSLAVDWGLDPQAAVLSEKDAAAPYFSDFETPFVA